MSNESKAITKSEPAHPAVVGAEMAVAQLIARKEKVLEILHTAMEKGKHFGLIPGCGDKPALFKAGAEMLALTFGLAPTFTITKTDLEGGHREYIITCSLRQIASGVVLGEGVGSCSTMEKKYRLKYGKPNPDLADVYNTVLKMAKKRSQVDATLTVVGASDLLTQDIEDMECPVDTYNDHRRDDVIEADFHDQRDRDAPAERAPERPTPPPAPNVRELIESARTADELKRTVLPLLAKIDSKFRPLAQRDYDARMAELLTRKAS